MHHHCLITSVGQLARGRADNSSCDIKSKTSLFLFNFSAYFRNNSVAGGGKGPGAVDSLRPAAATKRRAENSGKDHKLWPGRFPGTGEYGHMFHGNCKIMLREV